MQPILTLDLHSPQPRLRRLENVMAPVQSGSTMTIHDVSYLGNPCASLAESYGLSLSPERNLVAAFEAKRLDHAEVWSVLVGLLYPLLPPPAYSLVPLDGSVAAPGPFGTSGDDEFDIGRDREAWERGMARKRLVLDELFAKLIAKRDLQLLALVACILLHHVDTNPPPPRPRRIDQLAPAEPDYFGLPRYTSHQSSQPSSATATATASVVSAGGAGGAGAGGGGGGAITPAKRLGRLNQQPSSPTAAWTRTSGWSQILNASSFSLRSQLTPPHLSLIHI